MALPAIVRRQQSEPIQPASSRLPQKAADTNLLLISENGAATSDEGDLFKRAPVPATDFLSRQTQPKDVVAGALALPGVAGAVVALADGLRVAGEVPAELNASAAALGPAFNIFSTAAGVVAVPPAFIDFIPSPYLRPFDLGDGQRGRGGDNDGGRGGDSY